MNNIPTERSWTAIDPARASKLADVRLQFHHAAQFSAALGSSYLPPQLDDSHTNLGWDRSRGALISHGVRTSSGTVRVGSRPADLTLLVLRDETPDLLIPLDGSTVQQAGEDLREALISTGLDGEAFTLRRHDELPQHAVNSGAAFDAADTAALVELARWFANADLVLQSLRERIHSSDVRCWPHHLDIATLATLSPGRSSGAGLSPGDDSCEEPYFYVNAYPAPTVERVKGQLQGGGTWHTTGWIGAVLPGSRLVGDAARQAAQAQAFLESAFEACSRLAGAGQA